MALDFDDKGIAPFEQIVFPEAFSITGGFVYDGSSVQIIIGSTPNNEDFLASFTGGKLKARINNTNTEEVSGLVDGQAYNYILERDEANVVTIEVLGVGKSLAKVISGPFTLDNFGSYNNGALKYRGRLFGNTIFNDAGTDVRNYDFEQPEGSTTVPDTIGGKDATLSGFGDGAGFTEPAAPDIAITSPSEYSGTRADIDGNATFTVTGSCVDTVTAVEVSTDGQNWSVLDSAPTTSFSGTVVVNGQKTIHVRAANDTSATASVAGITAGFSLAIWSQSNGAGRGGNLQSYTVPAGAPTPIMYRNGVFSPMEDPTGIDSKAAGSMWPLLAQRYIDEGIPLILANMGQGGTTVQAWQPGTALYSRITAFASDVGGIDLALSIIGESDSGGTTKEDFKTRYLAIANAIHSAYGCDQYAVKFPIGNSTSNATRAEIVEAYDELIAENEFIKFGGDLSVIDIDTGEGEDGLHLKSDQHLIDGAAIIETQLFGDVVQVPDTTKPVITLNGSSTVNVSVGAIYNDAGASAVDDIDGDLTGAIVASVNVDTSTAGQYFVTYNVTDAAGNAADEVIRTVNVQAVATPNQPPVAVIQSVDPVSAGATVQLDASLSSDTEDGSVTQYSWAQTAGTPVTLSDTSAATPTFVAPESNQFQTLTFQVTVTDSEGLQDSATVDVDINAVVSSGRLEQMVSIDFEMVTDGKLVAYKGRANREVIRFKPVVSDGLDMLGEYLDLSRNDISKIEIVARDGKIDSIGDSLNISGDKLLARLGDLNLSYSSGETILYYVIFYIGTDAKGLVVSSEGTTGFEPLTYNIV